MAKQHGTSFVVGTRAGRLRPAGSPGREWAGPVHLNACILPGSLCLGHPQPRTSVPVASPMIALGLLVPSTIAQSGPQRPRDTARRDAGAYPESTAYEQMPQHPGAALTPSGRPAVTELMRMSGSTPGFGRVRSSNASDRQCRHWGMETGKQDGGGWVAPPPRINGRAQQRTYAATRVRGDRRERL